MVAPALHRLTRSLPRRAVTAHESETPRRVTFTSAAAPGWTVTVAPDEREPEVSVEGPDGPAGRWRLDHSTHRAAQRTEALLAITRALLDGRATAHRTGYGAYVELDGDVPVTPLFRRSATVPVRRGSTPGSTPLPRLLGTAKLPKPKPDRVAPLLSTARTLRRRALGAEGVEGRVLADRLADVLTPLLPPGCTVAPALPGNRLTVRTPGGAFSAGRLGRVVGRTPPDTARLQVERVLRQVQEGVRRHNHKFRFWPSPGTRPRAVLTAGGIEVSFERAGEPLLILGPVPLD